jgi:hypothetical protein
MPPAQPCVAVLGFVLDAEKHPKSWVQSYGLRMGSQRERANNGRQFLVLGSYRPSTVAQDRSRGRRICKKAATLHRHTTDHVIPYGSAHAGAEKEPTSVDPFGSRRRMRATRARVVESEPQLRR